MASITIRVLDFPLQYSLRNNSGVPNNQGGGAGKILKDILEVAKYLPNGCFFLRKKQIRQLRLSQISSLI